jgi:hypothetical protein
MKYKRETKYHDRLEILRKDLEKKAKILPSCVDEMNMAKIFRNLAEIRGIANEAYLISEKESDENEQRHKEVKRLEIDLRRLGETIDNQSLAVPFEDRGQFELTKELVEKTRNQLLRQLFGRALGTRGNKRFNFLPTPSPSPTPATASGQGLHDIDKFTEEEFSKVQLAQKIIKRVEVFIEIAKARFAEIERRRDGLEWEEKEENPLEFHTYEDMLHAYHRAVDGIMINIDAQVEARMASEDDIRKALEKLDENIRDFIERLVGFEELVRSQRDEALFLKYRQALKTSDIARKGAQYGLGAPTEK